MVKKRKSNVNNKIFIGLILLLLVFSPFLSQKTSTTNSPETIIRLSDRVVFGWLDVSPKETDQLHFFSNQSSLTQVKTTFIPMFPYENPFFLVLVDSAYIKDTFYTETLTPYLKNKKFELFTFENSWIESLIQARKKAETLADQCVLLLIGSPDFDKQIIDRDLLNYPLFCWTNNTEGKENSLSDKMVKATGGEIYSLADPKGIEKMDISIHAPLQDQKIQFLATIPFLKQFYSTRLIVQTSKNSYSFPIDPTKRIILQIKSAYRIIFALFIVSTLFVLLDLLKRSRKKWKKNQKKIKAKKALKKYCIAWIEEISKKAPTQRINKSPYVIGSSSECDYTILDDASVSARHFQIIESKCAFYIFDMQSRNGTFVNEKETKQKQLQDKDKIEIGKTVLIFHKSALQYISNEKVL
jgi:hypothetical protein